MIDLIYGENSRLRHDYPIQINKHDDHLMHILIHKRLLEQTKDDIEIQKRIEKHIKLHANFLKVLWEENNS